MKENDQKQSEVSPRGEMQGNGTSSNIHGKHWVGTEVHDQTWVMYTAQVQQNPKRIPKN